MKNPAEKTERREIQEDSALEIGGREMLDLAQNDPEDFILQYGIVPAMSLIEQDRWYYDLIVGKSTREEAKYEAFFDRWRETIGYDPSGNPQQLAWLESLRENYRQIVSPGFCSFVRKSGYPESNGEVRLYLAIKQDKLLELAEQLSAANDLVPSLYAFKINISDIERNDNAVIYLSDQVTQADLSNLLKIIAKLPGETSEVFDEFDFVTPLSRPVVASDRSTIIGQLAYNPFISHKGKAIVSGESARTPNEVFGRLVQSVKAQSSILGIAPWRHPEKSSNPEQIKEMAEALINKQIELQQEKYGAEQPYSVIEYCRLCLKKISEILEEK